MEQILTDVTLIVVNVAIAALGTMAGKAIKKWMRKHDHDLLGKAAEAAVRSIEQMTAKEGVNMTNPDKLRTAAESVQKLVPWMPLVVITAAIRAAVSKMNEERKEK